MKPRLIALLLLVGLVVGLFATPLTNKIAYRLGKTSAQWERRQAILAFERKQSSLPFTVEFVAGGFTCPWDIAWAPDGRLFVADRGGEIYLVDPDNGSKTLYHRIEVLRNQHTLHSGLFDLEFHPDFRANRYIYAYFSVSDPSLLPNPDPGLSVESGDWGLRNKVVRFRDTGTGLAFDREIFISDHGVRTRSSGGRLHFGPDGMLYIASPFATTWDAPQDPGNTLGKMLRVTPDGIVPTDNPFVDRPGHRGEIWTLGHKDIYGFDWHPVTGDLIAIEHGPTAEHVNAHGFDEINLLEKGANYGFPYVWGNWELAGSVKPLRFWSFPHPPGDLHIYKGDSFPAWRGDCFVSNMANSSLHRIRIAGGEVIEDEILLQWMPDPWAPFDLKLGPRPKTTVGRPRAVAEGPDGCLYLSTDWRMGSKGRDAIYRLRPGS